MKRSGIVIAALLLVIAVGGCGGGDEGGEETIARADYVEQAEAICSKALKEREAAVDKAFKDNEAGGTKAEEGTQLIGTVIEAAIPSLAAKTAELRQLGVPDSGAEQAEAMVEAFENAVAELEDDPLLYTKGKGEPFEPATELAAELKIDACAIP